MLFLLVEDKNTKFGINHKAVLYEMDYPKDGVNKLIRNICTYIYISQETGNVSF